MQTAHPAMDALFTDFYRKYHRYVHALCASRAASESDVHDLESIVWYEVSKNIERFQVEDPRGLLSRLISWRANSLFRSLRRDRQVSVEENQLLALLEVGQGGAISIEEKMALQEALAQEDEQDRKLLFGRYVEGFTWSELAALYGLHRNTVWKRTEAALQRLKQLLDADTLSYSSSKT